MRAGRAPGAVFARHAMPSQRPSISRHPPASASGLPLFHPFSFPLFNSDTAERMDEELQEAMRRELGPPGTEPSGAARRCGCWRRQQVCLLLVAGGPGARKAVATRLPRSSSLHASPHMSAGPGAVWWWTMALALAPPCSPLVQRRRRRSHLSSGSSASSRALAHAAPARLPLLSAAREAGALRRGARRRRLQRRVSGLAG